MASVSDVGLTLLTLFFTCNPDACGGDNNGNDSGGNLDHAKAAQELTLIPCNFSRVRVMAWVRVRIRVLILC